MWDFGIEIVVEIEYMILADTGVLFFIQADCQVSRVSLVKNLLQNLLGVETED